MIMTREDMLRELELLPVWTLNPEFVAHQAPRQIDATALTQAEPIQPIADVVVESAPVIAIPKPGIAEAPIKAKTAVNWLFYCPLDTRSEQDALTLLQNMVRAMQLVSTDYQITHDALANDAFQPERTLIFGLEAAKALLGEEVTLEHGAQPPYEHMQRPCWVVHHPKDLLENPALKREAWKIMCGAKAYMQPPTFSI